MSSEHEETVRFVSLVTSGTRKVRHWWHIKVRSTTTPTIINTKQKQTEQQNLKAILFLTFVFGRTILEISL